MTASRHVSQESLRTIRGSVVREFTPIDLDVDKSTIVLLHGIGSGSEHWGTFPDQFTDRHVIAIDPREATKLPHRPSMSDYATTVEDIIDQVADDTPIDLLGLSLGGVLAQELAIRQEKRGATKRIGNLALLATIPGYFVKQPSRNVLNMMKAADRSPELLETAAGILYGGDFIGNNDLAAELGVSREINRVTYNQQLGALASYMTFHPGQPYMSMFMFIRSHPARSISIPTLVMAGNPDPITPWPNSEEIARIIPNSTLVKVDRGGHLFALTRPDWTAKIVTDFFDKDRTKTA